MRWPSTKMPSIFAPPIQWARWYRDVMGWLVLPTRCAEDLNGYRTYLMRGLRASFYDNKDRHPNDDEADALMRQAQEETDKTRKAPLVHHLDRTSVSNGDLESWWGNRSKGRGEHRGIWVPMGRLDIKSTAHGQGLAVMAVDVDPRNGGVVDEWIPTVGPIARSPSGGVHVLCDPSNWPGARSTKEDISPGVDTKAWGGGIVVVSGSSSPGRAWEQWEHVGPVPERVFDEQSWNGPARLGSKRAGVEGGSGIEGSTATGSTFAEVLSLPAPDGTRQATGSLIIGILARQSSIPEDSVDAALAMLKEAGETDLDEWRLLLTRGPRTVDNAVDFIRAWNSTLCDPPWSDGAAENKTRSEWKTADRREGGNAGAEDYGVGEAWDPSGAPVGSAPARPAPVEEVATAEPSVAPTLTVKKKPFEIPAGFCISLTEGFPPEKFAEAMHVKPISLAALPKWVDWSEREVEADAYGYGVGPWLNRALAGGPTRGSFWSIGARTAKGGKTGWMGQLAEGLTLQGAMRLLNGEDGDIFMPFWLTEMERHVDLSYRMTARYLEIDSSMWFGGEDGHLVPGIQSIALKYAKDARVIWMAAEKRVSRAYANPTHPLPMMRDLTTNMDPMMIPMARGSNENPRKGAAILRMTKFAIQKRIHDFATWKKIDPSRIIPIVIIDPVQRFVDIQGGDRLTAINYLLDEARTIAHGEKWIVWITSDTTKGSSEGDKGMDGDRTAIAASAFAGTNNLAHDPDTVIVIHSEQVDPPLEGPRIVRVPVQIRVCHCRRALPGPPLSFIWHPHLGRYMPVDPTIKATGAPMDTAPRGKSLQVKGRPRPGRPRKHP